MSRPHILHIFSKLKQGGGPLNTFRVNEYSKFAHDYICNTSHASIGSPVKGQLYNFEVDRFSIWTALKIIKELDIKKYKILHAQGRGGAAYALIIKLLCIFLNHRVHIIYTYRGLIRYNGVKGLLQNTMEFFISWLASSFICVSSSEYQNSLSSYPARKGRSVIIPNGIIDEHLKNLSFKDVGRERDYTEVVLVGRVSREKDIAYGILLANSMFEPGSRYNIKIIGEVVPENRIYSKSLEDLVCKNGLMRVVTFCGGIDRSSCLREIQNADFIISSSDSEGLPTVLIEAQVLSTVCIASNVQGNIDVVKHAETGFLFDKGLTAVENGLALRSFTDKYDLELIRKNARADAINGFEVSTIALMIDQHYCGIISC